MRRGTPEDAVLRAVCDLLTAEQVWWMRCNTGTLVLADASGRRRVFRAGSPGMADVLAIPRLWHCCRCFDRINGHGEGVRMSKLRCESCFGAPFAWPSPLWIECKSATGRQSTAQQIFEAEVRAQGHAYLLTRDAREVAEWLRGTR